MGTIASKNNKSEVAALNTRSKESRVNMMSSDSMALIGLNNWN